MKSRQLVSVLALTWYLSAAGALAQSIPVKALFVGKQTDVKGQQFLEAIRSTIQQSNRFSAYDGQLDELPANGIAIYIYSIQVESAVGVGTTFTMILPLVSPQSPADIEPAGMVDGR